MRIALMLLVHLQLNETSASVVIQVPNSYAFPVYSNYCENSLLAYTYLQRILFTIYKTHISQICNKIMCLDSLLRSTFRAQSQSFSINSGKGCLSQIAQICNKTFRAQSQSFSNNSEKGYLSYISQILNKIMCLDSLLRSAFQAQSQLFSNNSEKGYLSHISQICNKTICLNSF